MIWLILFPLMLIVMVICYFTNPIVCLFCNEVGELPRIFRMWQTWDDSCDPRFFVMDKVPKFLKYDYDNKYEEYEDTTDELKKYNRTRWFVRLKPGAKFTFKERVQRYFCRVLWLTRNCAYGWAFFVFGKEANAKNLKFVKRKDDGKGHYYYIAYDPTKSILVRPWVIKVEDYPIIGKLATNCYLGWKISLDTDRETLCMIANRVVPRWNND